MQALSATARRHWFYLLLPAWLMAALGFRATHPWSAEPALGEAITLFDWCLFMPLLFVLCYRDMPRRALAVRAAALACAGFWIAGMMVPGAAHGMLNDWAWLRSAGLGVVIAFEGIAMVAMLRIVFASQPDPAALERQGIPPVIARLMLAEARFWRWVWAQIRGGRSDRK